MKIRNLMIACLMGIAVLGAAGVARAQDVRMFVRHEVADYGAWKKSYDAFAPRQLVSGPGRSDVRSLSMAQARHMSGVALVLRPRLRSFPATGAKRA